MPATTRPPDSFDSPTPATPPREEGTMSPLLVRPRRAPAAARTLVARTS
jgi:hypothetical protein